MRQLKDDVDVLLTDCGLSPSMGMFSAQTFVKSMQIHFINLLVACVTSIFQMLKQPHCTHQQKSTSVSFVITKTQALQEATSVCPWGITT